MSEFNDRKHYEADNFGYNTGFGQNYSQKAREQMTVQMDPSAMRLALQKLKSFCFVSMVLGFLVIVAGATTLGFAAANIGFPTFNFGPLLVGILFFIGGSVGFNGSKKVEHGDFTPESASTAKCCIVAVFAICVTTISLAVVSGVFAIISGAVCAGADIEFYSRNGNTRTKIDVKQYCSPNDTANTVLGFLDGVLCIFIAIWSIFGCIFFCVYGRHFGVRSRRRGGC